MGWADRCQHDAKPVLLTWHRVPASLFSFFFDQQAITLRMGSPLFIESVRSDSSFHRRALSRYSVLFPSSSSNFCVLEGKVCMRVRARVRIYKQKE